MHMPLLSRLDTKRHIAKRSLRARVFLLASSDINQIVPHALEAGVHRCLTKSNTMDDLVLAVEALRYSSSFSAAKVAPEVVAEYLATLKKRRRGGNKHVRHLTCRQREVLQLLAEGNSSRDVGAALKISTSTAETHRANIMRTIGCQSAAELVRYALRNHVVQARFRPRR